MNPDKPENFDLEKALTVLGVGAGATDEELRAAYLDCVRRHPPDRDPDVFEQIRDAYKHLSDPWQRASLILSAGPDPTTRLSTLLDGAKAARNFVGVQLWIGLLKEKRL